MISFIRKKISYHIKQRQSAFTIPGKLTDPFPYNYNSGGPSYQMIECSSAISHKNHWDQVNSWKNFRKFWNGPLWRNKSGLSSILDVAASLKSSNTEAFAKKLSQILACNIDNGVRGTGLRTCVRYSGLAHIWETRRKRINMATVNMSNLSWPKLCGSFSIIKL